MRPARALIGSVVAAVTLSGWVMPAAGAAVQPIPAVLHVGQIARQDLPPRPGSEPDTLVEPDVAVSPLDPQVALTVAHDGRYADGGAVGISSGWTHDGGRSWHHQPVPKITKAVGGTWERASDPVAAFGPDGTAYISTLLFGATTCPTAIGVSRSTDGGRTFGAPVLAHLSRTCAYSDDKDWLVVDTGARSPHRGRLYLFWTAFRFDAQGRFLGAPQALRWSDDQGRHWSHTVYVTTLSAASQSSQPMIQPDGTITDTYLAFPPGQTGEGPERPGIPNSAAAVPPMGASRAAAAPAGDRIAARTSRDGGATWGAEVTVTHDAGEGPIGIRCCLPSATADPVTGWLYVAWDSATPGAVRLSRSTDGARWSAPVQVNRDPTAGFDHVNVDVAAYQGRVFVSYGTRNTAVAGGRYVQQQVSSSYDGGLRFGPALSLGARSDLRYAAVAGGRFPGDYIGSAATRGRVYAVWCRSSRPADPSARYHQTLDAAVLRP